MNYYALREETMLRVTMGILNFRLQRPDATGV
jgi:hypothetical protein